jgi:hypothetical protein
MLITLKNEKDISIIEEVINHTELSSQNVYDAIFERKDTLRFKIFKLLHEKGYKWDTGVAYTAARKGDFEIIKYMYKNKTEDKTLIDQDLLTIDDEFICSLAVLGGNFELLKFLVSMDYTVNEECTGEAAAQGNLEMLKFLHTNGCPWDSSTCYHASGRGHLDCLQYAHEKGCPVDSDSFTAAMETHEEHEAREVNIPQALKIMKYLLKHNCITAKDTRRIIKYQSKHLPLTVNTVNLLLNTYLLSLRRIGDTIQPKCNDDVCSICLEDLTNESKGGYGMLDCGHCFHVKCLFEMYTHDTLTDDNHDVRCPLCRKLMTHSVKSDIEVLQGGRKVPKKGVNQKGIVKGLPKKGVVDLSKLSLNELKAKVDTLNLETKFKRLNKKALYDKITMALLSRNKSTRITKNV